MRHLDYLDSPKKALFEDLWIDRLLASGSILKHPISDEPMVLDIVLDVMDAIDFDKKFARAGEVLDGDLAESGVVDADKLQESLELYIAFRVNTFLMLILLT
jgi:hypothetical protein